MPFHRIRASFSAGRACSVPKFSGYSTSDLSIRPPGLHHRSRQPWRLQQHERWQPLRPQTKKQMHCWQLLWFVASARKLPTLRLSHCRVVSIHLLALSKPGQPHQKASRRLSRGAPIASRRGARSSFTVQTIAMRIRGRSRRPSCPTRAVTETTFGGAGGSRTRVQHASTSTSRQRFGCHTTITLQADEARLCSWLQQQDLNL